MMLYKNKKAMGRLRDNGISYLEIVALILQVYSWEPFLFIISLGSLRRNKNRCDERQ